MYKAWTPFLKCIFCDKELLLLSHFSRVRLCVTPQTAAHQAPPSLGFSRQEHWSGAPLPSPAISRRNVKQAPETEPKTVNLPTRTLAVMLKSYDCAQAHKGKHKQDEELEAIKKRSKSKGRKIQCLK